jgi:hypothetical protein
MYIFQEFSYTGHQWIMPVILAIQEAEIRRITVERQPGQIVSETLSQKRKKKITKRKRKD